MNVGLPKEDYLLFDDMTDEEVVCEAVNGDHEALEYLINKIRTLSNQS